MHKKLPSVFIFVDQYNDQIFQNNITNIGIIYRNYNKKNRENELIKISKACKEKRYQLFVSNDIKLALKFRTEGVYIPSFNKTNKFINFEKRNITFIGSAHNQIEISQKISQNCSVIFLSPLFYVKGKNEKLNIHRFNFLALRNKVNIFALGGISHKNIKKLNLLSIKGFGGIRMFKKKPAFKRPVFLKK
jgi:thiamine-phosphate pyrophosphorylase